MELIFLSEYSNKERIAHVFRFLDDERWLVHFYQEGFREPIVQGPYLTESQAEDAAEDWVLCEN